MRQEANDVAKKKKKKKKVNKSEAIRAYKRRHPGAMPEEVSAALLMEGIVAPAAYVSVILAKARPEQLIDQNLLTKRQRDEAEDEAEWDLILKQWQAAERLLDLCEGSVKDAECAISVALHFWEKRT